MGLVRESLENKLERLGQKEKEILIDFKRSMEARGLTDLRVRKNLNHILDLMKLGFDIVSIDKKNIESVLSKIERSDYKAWTKHDIKANLKKYIAYRLDTEYNPQQWIWIKTRIKKKDRPLIAEGDILEPEEIEAMIKATTNLRNKALLAVLYESGARPSEILTLRVKDIRIDRYGAIVNIQESKTIKRPVRIVNSVPYLISWLNIHPYKDDGNKPLWVGNQSELDSPTIVNLTVMRRIMINAAKKSGIRNGRRIYPYLLRHSRITHLLRNPSYSQAIVKRIVGWTDDSEQISTYLHMSNDTVDKAVLAAEGKINGEIENGKMNLDKPIICPVPTCRAENPQDTNYCIKCHTPLDMATMVNSDDLLRSILTKVPELLEIYNNPDIMRQLKIKQKTKAILKVRR